MYFIIIAASCWFVAQTMKVLLETIVNKKFDISRYFGDGGYPSCHTAFVVGGVTSILLKTDFANIGATNDSAKILGLSLILTFVIIRDALGSRRQQGQTAEAVNRVVEFWKNTVEESFFKMFPVLKQQGHMPHEVIAGAVTGIITAYTASNMIDNGGHFWLLVITGAMLFFVILVGVIININRSSNKQKNVEIDH